MANGTVLAMIHVVVEHTNNITETGCYQKRAISSTRRLDQRHTPTL